ncbi:hypothetical protein CS022_22165 [Veronia nyctiphanis]|uniref:Uncharacterized protein n=1 Tax=Veronia nyctiphanis TaxID=1278244 RepID=A0A4Q0YJF1_9GAMM|nr:hypothetical protein [Veronia nyctiphanis]RXJ70837.1 hypothetical protein CS022_22165 [Veronia nyctiphanis]
MTWLLDLKYSLRQLAKARSFAALMLFIIIGSLTVTMVGFNYVYTVTVKPLSSEREQSVRTVRQLRSTVYEGRSLTRVLFLLVLMKLP